MKSAKVTSCNHEKIDFIDFISDFITDLQLYQSIHKFQTPHALRAREGKLSTGLSTGSKLFERKALHHAL